MSAVRDRQDVPDIKVEYMTNEELEKFLNEKGVNLHSVFPGTDPTTTQEQRNQAVYDSLQKMFRGEFEVVADVDE